MAKKKSKKKKGHRRRMSGISLQAGGLTGGLARVLATVGGYAAGRYLTTMTTTGTSPMLTPKIAGAIQTAAGVLAVAKGKKAWIRDVGAGLGAAGGVTLLGSQGFQILPAAVGMAPANVMLQRQTANRLMSGFRDVPTIGRFPQPGNIGFPKPGNIGGDRERARMARMYAGVYQ